MKDPRSLTVHAPSFGPWAVAMQGAINSSLLSWLILMPAPSLLPPEVPRDTTSPPTVSLHARVSSLKEPTCTSLQVTSLGDDSDGLCRSIALGTCKVCKPPLAGKCGCCQESLSAQVGSSVAARTDLGGRSTMARSTSCVGDPPWHRGPAAGAPQWRRTLTR